MKPAFDQATWDGLAAREQEGLRLLVSRMEEDWTVAGLTRIIYGVPKLQAGLPLEADATAELKAAQRALFAAIYQLVVGADTGPRLPTLFLSLGAAKMRMLLGG